MARGMMTPRSETRHRGLRDGTKGPPSSVAYQVNPALPFLSAPTVNGSTLTLTASESLDSTTTPANDAFTVTVNGDDNAVTNVGISGTTVTLTLTDAVIQSDTVTVAYDAPATDFLTTGTEAVLSLTQADVTNNTLVSTDKTLSEISFDGSTVKGFDRTHAVRAYTTGVANSVSSAVLEATPNHAGAIVKVLRDGAVVHTADRGETAEYTVVMSSVGQPYWFQIQVEPEDPEASPETYDVIIGRQSTASGAWKVIDDLESGSLRDIDGLSGIWSDGTTTWVLDTDSLTVRAYEQDGTRDSTKDFSLDPDNDHPKGIWADDATIYVGQARTDYRSRAEWPVRVQALRPNARQQQGPGRRRSRDETIRFVDFWSDGETLWTAAGIASGLSMRSRLDPENFTQDSSQSFRRRHLSNTGIWSDGETFWVADPALRLRTGMTLTQSGPTTVRTRRGTRPGTSSINTESTIRGPRSLVCGRQDAAFRQRHLKLAHRSSPEGLQINKILSWNIPPSSTTGLTKLSLDGTDIALVGRHRAVHPDRGRTHCVRHRRHQHS